jgi:hypothetical protein
VTRYNNTLSVVFTTTSETQTVTVPPGQYDVLTLAGVLDELIPRIVVTWSSESWTFLFESRDATDAFTLRASGSTMFKVIGLDPATDYSGTQVAAPYLCDLGGSRYLSLETSLPTTNVEDEKITTSCLQRIPVAGEFGELNTYTPGLLSWSTLKDPVLSTIEIAWKDSDGNNVDWQGLQWTVTLLIDVTPMNLGSTLLSLYQQARDKDKQQAGTEENNGTQ